MDFSYSPFFEERNPYAPEPDIRFSNAFILLLRLELWTHQNLITGKYHSPCDPALVERGECCETHKRMLEEQRIFVNEMKRLAGDKAYRVRSLKQQSLIHFCRATGLTPQIVREASRKNLGLPDNW